MFRRLCLSASGLFLLFATVTTAQEPKTVQEALDQIAKIEGQVKFDPHRKVVIEIDV
jgi:hypothetical protein